MDNTGDFYSLNVGSIPAGGAMSFINISMSDNILFAQVNFNKFLDIQLAAKEILEINQNLWFWDDYRETNMLPLMTKGSFPGKRGTTNFRKGEFQWLPYVPFIIKEWFEETVFPWMGMKTRIMALKTFPNRSNLEHIDCQLSEVGTRQHKFRLVLQGKTNTLYFKTKNGDVRSPDISGPFIMDGGWPHGMSNSADEVKLTIAAGASWNGLDEYKNIDILMKKSDHILPDDLNPFCNKSNI